MMRVYPDARIEDVQDTLASVSFPDPYRWLENDSDEVRQWQRVQAALATSHVHEWPHFDRLRKLVERFSVDKPERGAGLPRYAAGQWFRTHTHEGASQTQVTVSDKPMDDGRVLFDTITENKDRPPFLSWIAPSPDGRTLALGICADGSESNTIRLIDVDSGRVLRDPPSQILMDNWTCGAQWLPDSSGFFFTAIVGPPIELNQRVYLHRRFPTPTTEQVDIPWITAKEYRAVAVSRDGRHAVALERQNNLIPIAFACLKEETLQWRRFVTLADGMLAGHAVGERYIAVTNIGASRGRLVAIPLDADDPNNPHCWQELVGESDAVLRTVTPVGDVLYLSELVDTYARVRIVDRDGKQLGEVPLPGPGAIGELPFPMSNLFPKGHPQKFLFAFSSLTVSPAIYSHTPGHDRLEVLQGPQVRLENTVVEDRWAVSTDGTRIPYHLVRRTDLNTDQPQPTLIYAYGGYNVPLVPQFPGPMAALVAVGAVYVHVHLRGGGEFGLEWWAGGRMRNKQNTYNDLYAVAEDLIATKRSTPQMLAISGGSDGGLLAGVAATQRPDLWKVVVPRVPILDLIGACRDPYGRWSVVIERADIEDPNEVRRLASFSAYQLVSDGVRYPAIFVDAGDTDPRCPPWHARKFAARLQAATAGDGPILLHVWENVGHGWATDKNVAVNEHTEWLAFTLRHLCVDNWVC